jgi:hypothetical protein
LPLLEQLAEEGGHAHAGALQLLIDDRRRARIVGLVERETVLLWRLDEEGDGVGGTRRGRGRVGGAEKKISKRGKMRTV